MLYDKKWDKEVKADPFTLESVIAWLEMQPKRKTYCYVDNGNCLAAQYLQAHGFAGVVVVPGMFRQGADGPWQRLPRGLQFAAGSIPYTFGAALKRARKVAARGHT